MIKFFKHIRQQLLPQTRFSKYILYAIGEIVLVTISILLALQVSNWNADRMNTIEEILLLKSIESQFIEELNELKEQSNRYTKLKNDALKVLKLTPGDPLTKSDLKSGLGTFIWAGSYSPGKGALEGAISSGKINLIKNSKLRSVLNGWSGVVNETIDNEEIMRDYVIMVVIPKLAEHGLDVIPLYPYGSIGKSLGEVNENFLSSDNYDELLNNAEIRSLIKFRLGWLMHSEYEFGYASQRCNSVIEAIQIELKNKKQKPLTAATE